MLTLTGTLKSIFGWRTTASRSARQQGKAIEATQREQSAQATAADEEQTFLASIAHLPAEEREKHIAKRKWYRQLVERQALIEVEHNAQHDWWK